MGPDKGASYVTLQESNSLKRQMHSGSCASMDAILQLENDLIDFSWVKFFAFENSIYSHVCDKLDYYIINLHFTVIFDSWRATNYSDSFLSWAQNKSFKFAFMLHTVFQSLKVIGTNVFALNPRFFIKCFLQELNMDW